MNNVLNSFIIEEMKKKEKILEQVLDQTKNIRKSFESFQKSMENKSFEISNLQENVNDLRVEVNELKTQVEEVGTLKNNLHKMKQELIKMKILQKLNLDKQDKDNVGDRGLLEWHRHIEMQMKQQKMCKACRREAKHRYKAHKSQEW